uniref:DUF19 domain-containing protein n=1 Tax=Panagrellus redivivus TaxID=6233 RepID=A0A7E4UYM0_PANRE
MLLQTVLLSVIAASQAAKFVDQISRQSTQLLTASQNGQMIRQCSCEEERKCVGELKDQSFECFHECWHIVKDVTPEVENLGSCFEVKQYIVNNMVDCMQGAMRTCVNHREGKDIPYTDISVFLNKGMETIHKQADTFLATMGGSGRHLIDTALKIGVCMKDCIIKKNSNGFCFDTANCQSLIETKEATKSLKKCIKNVGWKKEAGELCECSVKAGVKDMEQYCSMLRTMNGGSRGQK